ncbi:cadherin-1-like isoform X2 [Plectropomus leopardus]|nr:cadherin-1-like isoform X2 [Plectropomus leopardus]
METAWFVVLSLLIIFFQDSALVVAEESTCVPGFKSDILIFPVSRQHLKRSMRLGDVGFSDCTDRTRFVFNSEDSHFAVQTDGILKVNRPVDIRGYVEFLISSWDSKGRKISVPVRVLYYRQNIENHRQNVAHDHNHQQHLTEADSGDNTESATEPQVPTWELPTSGGGLRRRKRDFVIPPLSLVENDRGPYPKKVAQIRSSEDETKKIYYSITGPGADQAPIGLFIMDRDSGSLYVRDSLDREEQDRYTFVAHAVADGSVNVEEPMEIVLTVIDLNDNKPIFTQDTYQGEVAEASPKGFEVITVVATDLDQPGSDNSDIRYRIRSQKPQLPSNFLFDINPVSGVIRVNADGLDREKYPTYTLVIQASDMAGEGLTGQATVVLNVTDSNDNAPAFTHSFYEATVAENEVNAEVITMSVTDGDEPHCLAWNAKFTIIDGDPGGLFTVKTGINKTEGTIFTVKGLDFEKSRQHTLLVAVENEIPFAIPLPTATATVNVHVSKTPDPVQCTCKNGMTLLLTMK